MTGLTGEMDPLDFTASVTVPLVRVLHEVRSGVGGVGPVAGGPPRYLNRGIFP